MSPSTMLQDVMRRYLQERRQLGFALAAPATELMRFAHFADSRGHQGPLTRELQIEWARQHVRRTSTVTAPRRLEVLRPFTAYYRQFEPGTEVLPKGTLGRSHRRLAPHIYTEAEVLELLRCADGLEPSGGLRPLLYRTLFGLIAAVGLRLSEALKLRLEDVDLDAATIRVRETKFHKSRCLPIDATVVDALREYRRARDQQSAPDATAPFFVSRTGGFLPKRTVQCVFACMRRRLQWRARGDHANPRIHDLRHSFVVRRIQRWRETGVSIDHAMFWLCTYLGHTKISDTYWYLTGVPELMEIVGAKFEIFAVEGGRDE